MVVGSAFNPFRVFTGCFTPFWLLELPVSTLSCGAKLCYIRLLGFAGKDGYCYPSIETLARTVGVSRRQAAEYVAELIERGFIETRRRGMGKTNVYRFLWHGIIDQQMNSLEVDPNPEIGSHQEEEPALPTTSKASGWSDAAKHQLSEQLVKLTHNTFGEVPPDLISSLRSVSKGASVDEVLRLFWEKYSEGYKVGKDAGPKSWAWFVTVAKTHFSARAQKATRAPDPEPRLLTPTIPEPAARRSGKGHPGRVSESDLLGLLGTPVH